MAEDHPAGGATQQNGSGVMLISSAQLVCVSPTRRPLAPTSVQCLPGTPATASHRQRVTGSCCMQVIELITKAARKGATPSQIGVLLRDQHGINQVRYTMLHTTHDAVSREGSSSQHVEHVTDDGIIRGASILLNEAYGAVICHCIAAALHVALSWGASHLTSDVRE